jgi:hypothetical protein
MEVEEMINNKKWKGIATNRKSADAEPTESGAEWTSQTFPSIRIKTATFHRNRRAIRVTEQTKQIVIILSVNN